MKPELAPVPVVPAIDENLPLGGLEKPAGQIHQRAFARAGFAHNGHGGSGGNVKGEVLQHIFASVRIPEGHVPELNLTQERLPVFRLGVEHVAILGFHLWGVLDLRDLVHEAGHPLNGGLEGDEFGDVGRRHLNRFEDAYGIGGEGGESGDFQHLLGDHVPTPEQHNGYGHGGEEENQGNVDGVQPGGTDAGVVHGLGEGAEALRILVFNDQGFGGFGAGDALVEGACNLGIDFPNLPVPVENPVLEVAGENGDDRHNEDDHQGQPPVKRQHGGEGAEHVEHGPENVRHVPGDHTGNPVGVAHHPGENVAHRGHVVEGEGQGL